MRSCGLLPSTLPSPGAEFVVRVDRALVHVSLYRAPIALVNKFRQVYLAHHGRHNVTVFQMEVVVWSVEVGRHHGDIVCAVLQIVRLAHLQSGYLGYGIFLVGIFQWRCEQTVLLHRLRSILGVYTRRAQEE